MLERIGADLHVDVAAGRVRVRRGELRGTVVNGAELPDLIDEVPALAVAAALAVEGTLDVQGAGELRAKESDRIETVAALVGRSAGPPTPSPTGSSCSRGVPPRPGVVRLVTSRIAMAGAVAALGVADSEAVRCSVELREHQLPASSPTLPPSRLRVAVPMTAPALGEVVA